MITKHYKRKIVRVKLALKRGEDELYKMMVLKLKNTSTQVTEVTQKKVEIETFPALKSLYGNKVS